MRAEVGREFKGGQEASGEYTNFLACTNTPFSRAIPTWRQDSQLLMPQSQAEGGMKNVSE